MKKILYLGNTLNQGTARGKNFFIVFIRSRFCPDSGQMIV